MPTEPKPHALPGYQEEVEVVLGPTESRAAPLSEEEEAKIRKNPYYGERHLLDTIDRLRQENEALRQRAEAAESVQWSQVGNLASRLNFYTRKRSK